jgi:hypothetical protein
VSYRILARVNALILGSTLVMGVWAATPADAAAAASSPGWRVVASVGNSSHGELPGFFAATGPRNAFSSWECVSCSRSARADNFIRHWDGRSWRRSISLPVSLNYPRSVIALGASSSSNLWAFTNNGRAAIWNGHAWKISSLPTWVLRPSRVGDPFAQAAVFGPGNAWVFCIGAMAQRFLGAVTELPFHDPAAERLRQFIEVLEQGGVTTTVRKRKGADIDAACGQLRLRSALATGIPPVRN